jgi:hypothetical protein
MIQLVKNVNYIFIPLEKICSREELLVGLDLVFHGITEKILLSRIRKMVTPISSNVELSNAKSLSPWCMVFLQVLQKQVINH